MAMQEPADLVTHAACVSLFISARPVHQHAVSWLQWLQCAASVLSFTVLLALPGLRLCHTPSSSVLIFFTILASPISHSLQYSSSIKAPASSHSRFHAVNRRAVPARSRSRRFRVASLQCESGESRVCRRLSRPVSHHKACARGPGGRRRAVRARCCAW